MSPTGGSHWPPFPPTLHVPVQHWKLDEHEPVHEHCGLSTHVPFEHAPVQQSDALVHATPRSAQARCAHAPFVHTPEQQLLSSEQLAPIAAQIGLRIWHTSLEHEPLQQLALEQSVHSSAHPCAHVPFVHVSEQHSSSTMQLPPFCVQLVGGS